ncbi:MAG: OmpH family outer membrane protein [Candidatus Latescibacteria bacterium]|nr:OmpH family outer membrane protein [Candidatus Latescibacterota bacterium]
MPRKSLWSILASLVVCVAMSCSEGERRFGYVDTARLLSQYGKATIVRAELDSVASDWASEIKRQAEMIKELRQELIMPSADSKAADIEVARIRMIREEIAHNAMRNTLQDRLMDLETEKMSPVYATLNTALADYGQENGLTIIWGATDSGNIVFADEEADLTDEVLISLTKNR